MSELDLDAIEVREREAWPERDDSNDDKDRLRASVTDVPALVAEVRRLRDTVQRVRELAYEREDRWAALVLADIRRALDGGDPS